MTLYRIHQKKNACEKKSYTFLNFQDRRIILQSIFYYFNINIKISLHFEKYFRVYKNLKLRYAFQIKSR